jgi:hypothetical protein
MPPLLPPPDLLLVSVSVPVSPVLLPPLMPGVLLPPAAPALAPPGAPVLAVVAVISVSVWLSLAVADVRAPVELVEVEGLPP